MPWRRYYHNQHHCGKWIWLTWAELRRALDRSCQWTWNKCQLYPLHLQCFSVQLLAHLVRCVWPIDRHDIVVFPWFAVGKKLLARCFEFLWRIVSLLLQCQWSHLFPHTFKEARDEKLSHLGRQWAISPIKSTERDMIDSFPSTMIIQITTMNRERERERQSIRRQRSRWRNRRDSARWT